MILKCQTKLFHNLDVTDILYKFLLNVMDKVV